MASGDYVPATDDRKWAMSAIITVETTRPRKARCCKHQQIGEIMRGLLLAPTCLLVTTVAAFAAEYPKGTYAASGMRMCLVAPSGFSNDSKGYPTIPNGNNSFLSRPKHPRAHHLRRRRGRAVHGSLADDN